MMLDAAMTFVAPPAPPASAVGAAGAVVQIGNVIDLLGFGVGVAPSPSIIGNATLFGQDPVTGVWALDFEAVIGTSFVTGTAATGNLSIQVAPDLGTPTYLPGTWEDAEETGPKAASELVANAVLRMKMPPAPPGTPRPRYMRLVLKVPAATDFTAGTITAAFFVQGRDDLSNKQAASNYVVQ